MKNEELLQELIDAVNRNTDETRPVSVRLARELGAAVSAADTELRARWRTHRALRDMKRELIKSQRRLILEEELKRLSGESA